MKKSIWVLNFKTNDLKSVENISSGLVQFYQSLKINFEVVEIVLEELSTHRALLNELKKKKPDYVAVVHPSVNHHPFFHSLLTIAGESSYYIHVFGNFVRNGDLWEQQAHLLRNKKMVFLAPSESYRDVLAHFIPRENLSIFPFPTQQPPKAMLPGPSSELKLIFAGRFHEQKNIIQLMRALNTFAEEKHTTISLKLMVCFDDFNPTTLQRRKIQGEQYARFLHALTLCSSSLKITLIPHRSFEEMCHMFSSCHAFISFSSFLDEDYGCAVLEALRSGLPCIVTKWGGYGDFCKEFPGHCFGLNVSEENNSLYVDVSCLGDYLSRAESFTADQRKELSEKAGEFVSFNRLQVILNSVSERIEPFISFKRELGEFSRGLRKGNAVENFKKYYYSFWNFPKD